MITLLTTGGTFDKIYYDALSEFSIGEPMAGTLLSEAGVDQDYEVVSVLKKDSLEMTEDDRQQLSQFIATSPSSKIIITHGTDTMVDTAKTIASILNGHKDKTIIFVGAIQPSRMAVTDSRFNLGFAFAAVQLMPAGIYITMNGRVFPYNTVIKNRAAGRFETISKP